MKVFLLFFKSLPIRIYCMCIETSHSLKSIIQLAALYLPHNFSLFDMTLTKGLFSIQSKPELYLSLCQELDWQPSDSSDKQVAPSGPPGQTVASQLLHYNSVILSVGLHAKGPALHRRLIQKPATHTTQFWRLWAYAECLTTISCQPQEGERSFNSEERFEGKSIHCISACLLNSNQTVKWYRKSQADVFVMLRCSCDISVGAVV